MTKRERQIKDMETELRLTKSPARRRDLVDMIAEVRKLIKMGR